MRRPQIAHRLSQLLRAKASKLRAREEEAQAGVEVEEEEVGGVEGVVRDNHCPQVRAFLLEPRPQIPPNPRRRKGEARK
tara:strand:+ start:382 stop:618 length:237 start_codon:yes stop_codon:yes gene_type:complete